MIVNLKMKVRYDGGGFAGWQVQPGLRTVQGELERALARIASQPVAVRGAGRTDSGVHALGQVCNFLWPLEADAERIGRAISGMLSPDLRVESIEEVEAAFDSRFSAKAKRYAYAFSLSRFSDPFSARYAWQTPWPVDLELLERLARELTGRRDFAGYACAGSGTKSTTRTLFSVDLKPGGVTGPIDASGLWRIEFRGDGFLYKMVRNISGTLIDIARGQLPQSTLFERLNAAGPFRGHTAPARGLTLIEVEY